jgi:hypothetical protein
MRESYYRCDGCGWTGSKEIPVPTIKSNYRNISLCPICKKILIIKPIVTDEERAKINKLLGEKKLYGNNT